LVAPHRSHALSLRSVLLLSVLLPTVGMLVLATLSAVEAQSERRAADRLEDDAAGLVELIEARAAIADEETASSVVSIAGDLGVGPDELTELYGVDYAAQVRAARAVVDADPVVSRQAELVGVLGRLDEVRADLDAGRATFDQVHETLAAVIDELDALWLAQFSQVSDDVETDTLSGTVHARLDALQSAFHALSDGSDRAVLAIQAVLGSDDEDTTRLLAATFRYEAVTELFPEAFGPAAADVWQAHLDDPTTTRFESTLDGVVTSVLAGEPSPLSDDPVAFGEAFVDGATWGRNLADIVQAAGFDLRDVGTRQAEDATRDLQVQVAVAVLLTVLTVAGALALARRVTQPVQRLERAAHEIHAGRFDLDPIEPSGPRELADTATAFNDMASTLSAVEAHAVALADDPDAPVLSNELPGRTGRALQVALNRVRSSIQVAEQRRRELEKAATHDALTGLLNRAAAFEMIGRDLSRVEREGGSVMALFVDLDGLKPINDEHGHAVGDDALRRTAEALRAATRASDVVARLGGDEFLVAGVVHDGRREVDDAAERIRQRVSEQVVVSPAGEIPLRCSIGAAVGGAHASVESLVNDADAALYEAKRGGRNRVAWHPASEPADR
jgi:diguanylate cyclase (GGDEF)-like protein